MQMAELNKEQFEVKTISPGISLSIETVITCITLRYVW